MLASASRSRRIESSIPANKGAPTASTWINSRQPFATASKCPARFPLSTEEMYWGSSGRRSRVSYQLKRWPRYFSRLPIVAERRLQMFRRVQNAQPAEIMRGNFGKKIEADIRRRCAMGDNRFGIFLKIIRRKKVLLSGDECFEEAPSAARDSAQGASVGGCDRLKAVKMWGQADPTRDGRRGGPEKQERRSSGIGLRPCKSEGYRLFQASGKFRRPCACRWRLT